MILIRQVSAALLLVRVTLWFECGGIATLITWMRRAVGDDSHKLGPFRLRRAGRASHYGAAGRTWATSPVVGVLVSLALLSVVGTCVVCFSDQLCDGWLWRCRPPIELAPVGAAGEHHRSIDVRSICKPSVCDRYATRRPRKMMLQKQRPKLGQLFT